MSIEGKKEDNDGHQDVEEESKDRSPAALDIVEQNKNTDVGDAVMESDEVAIIIIILLHEKFLQFDWLRAVEFQLNLKYLHVKISNLLRVAV